MLVRGLKTYNTSLLFSNERIPCKQFDRYRYKIRTSHAAVIYAYTYIYIYLYTYIYQYIQCASQPWHISAKHIHYTFGAMSSLHSQISLKHYNLPILNIMIVDPHCVCLTKQSVSELRKKGSATKFKLIWMWSGYIAYRFKAIPTKHYLEKRTGGRQTDGRTEKDSAPRA